MSFYNYDIFEKSKNKLKSKHNEYSKDIEYKEKIINNEYSKYNIHIKEVQYKTEYKEVLIENPDIKHDIDKIKKLNPNEYVYGVYLLEVMTMAYRYVYVGSSKVPHARFKAHIYKLKNDNHHNKELQKFYTDNKHKIRIKFSVIKSVEKDEDLIHIEHRALIDIASKFHDRFDRMGRKVYLVHSN